MSGLVCLELILLLIHFILFYPQDPFTLVHRGQERLCVQSAAAV